MTRLRAQTFDIRLNGECRIRTPIRQCLVNCDKFLSISLLTWSRSGHQILSQSALCSKNSISNYSGLFCYPSLALRNLWNCGLFERGLLGHFQATPKSTPCQSSDLHFLSTIMQLSVLSSKIQDLQHWGCKKHIFEHINCPLSGLIFITNKCRSKD